MSLQFNDTATYKGIVQIYEKECEFPRGFISGNEDRLKEFVADANLAHDDLLSIGFRSSGMWQLDDSNNEGYPELYTNLISGQRDYTFLRDNYGNLILDFYRVFVKDTNGIYKEVTPVDKQTPTNNQMNTDMFIDGREQTGTPSAYDKTANGLEFDFVPNYNSTNGIKILINREGSYFSYTDTTKTPGVPGNLHRWYAIKPAEDYARRNGKANYSRIVDERVRLERLIEQTFMRRERDVKPRLRANIESTR